MTIPQMIQTMIDEHNLCKELYLDNFKMYSETHNPQFKERADRYFNQMVEVEYLAQMMFHLTFEA